MHDVSGRLAPPSAYARARRPRPPARRPRPPARRPRPPAAVAARRGSNYLRAAAAEVGIAGQGQSGLRCLVDALAEPVRERAGQALVLAGRVK